MGIERHAADILPDSEGYDLGADNYRWDLFVKDLDVSNPIASKVSLTGGLNLAPNPPAPSNAPGVYGDIKVDSGYLYVCTAANTWKRVALVAF